MIAPNVYSNTSYVYARGDHDVDVHDPAHLREPIDDPFVRERLRDGEA